MFKRLLQQIGGRREPADADPMQGFVQARCAQVSSSEFLRQRIDEATFCIIDCETTGLDPTKDVILNIAGVKVKRGCITKIYDVYVRPPFAVPMSSIQWHGITDEMLVDKPRIAEVLPEFVTFLRRSILVGHHVNFDLRMLSRHLQECYDCNLASVVWLDTMLLHKLVMDHSMSTELDDLLDFYAIECDQRHRALGDSLATAKLFLKIVQELPPTFRTVGDMYRAQQDTNRKENL